VVRLSEQTELESGSSGFVFFLYRIKWTVLRLLFLILIFLVTISGGAVLYILGPIFTYALFRDFNHLKYRHYFWPMAAIFWKGFMKWLTDKDYREAFVIPLTSPPMNAPDPNRVKLAEDWKGDPNDCGGCVNCCEQLRCPLLDKKSRLCPSYGSFYWRYFSCGRYPVSNAHARYYDCKKWVVIEDPS